MKFGIYDETRIYAANQEEYDSDGWAPRVEYETKADAAANQIRLSRITNNDISIKAIR